MSNDPLKVTPESMQEFINQFPNLCIVLHEWMIDRARNNDARALMHFTEYGKICLQEACRILENGGDEQLKTFKSTLN